MAAFRSIEVHSPNRADRHMTTNPSFRPELSDDHEIVEAFLITPTNDPDSESEIPIANDLEGNPSVSAEALREQAAHTSPESAPQVPSIALWKRILFFPWQVFVRLFDFTSLLVLLAVVATIPIVQWASLGYMLEAARRIATTGKWKEGLPGVKRAGRIGTIAAFTYLSWLPVWLVSDYAYNAELIAPGSNVAVNWRVAATLVIVGWVTHITWALLRGARWWHFLWPAPIRFLLEIWRTSTWARARDAVWEYTVGLKIPQLTWLGLRATVGSLIWLSLPATLMVIGLRGEQNAPLMALLGFIGAVMMGVVILYLPFLQIHMAVERKWWAIFQVRKVREQFKHAPWAFLFALLFTLAFAIPLYLLRIEATPEEYVWLPSLFFVLFTLPAKLFTGWANHRGNREVARHWWPLRYVAWSLQLALVPFYIGMLYLALLVDWHGILSIYLQHAFLAPVPFKGT